MLMSRKRKFIFIHIYKNAGSSVTNALLPFATSKWQRMIDRVSIKLKLPRQFDPAPFPVHIRAPELVKAIGKEAFDSFYSFAIVRNPWDWQVSLYNYALKSTSHPQHELTKALVVLTNTSGGGAQKKSGSRRISSIRQRVNCLWISWGDLKT